MSMSMWRSNVRARLALTIGARLRAGYAEAACAAWRGILNHTGRSAPAWMERAGEWAIRRLCPAREGALGREEVSPL